MVSITFTIKAAWQHGEEYFLTMAQREIHEVIGFEKEMVTKNLTTGNSFVIFLSSIKDIWNVVQYLRKETHIKDMLSWKVNV